MQSSRHADRRKDKRTMLEVLTAAGGELNVYELRHQYLHWMTTSQINSIGRALMADGLIDCELVDAPYSSKKMAQFGPSKVTVWRLSKCNRSVAT